MELHARSDLPYVHQCAHMNGSCCQFLRGMVRALGRRECFDSAFVRATYRPNGEKGSGGLDTWPKIQPIDVVLNDGL